MTQHTPSPKAFSTTQLVLLALVCVGFAIAPQLIVKAPNEPTMGLVQRIFYFHVPCAWQTMIGAFIAGGASALYLFRGSEKSRQVAIAAAELAVVFGLCVLFTGPLWARKAWGVWWQWDVRLTTSALLWIIFVAALFAEKYGGPGGPRLSAGSAPPAVAKAAQLLRRLLDEAALLPLSELVHKIVSGTGYELAMLAAPDGRQRSRNVWKLVHLACQDDHLSCGEFADKLSAMREFNMRESEAPLDSGDSVKLMTVHASKGLEFAAVALPCLGAAALQNSARSIFHPCYGIAFNTKRLEEEEIPAWYQVAGYLDRQMEWEERKRLLYVAMTRARDFLALFMKAEGRKVQSYRTMLRTVLSLDGDHSVLPEPGSTMRLSLPFSSALVPYSLSFAQPARRAARVAPALQLAKPSELLLAPLPVHIEYPKVNELGLSRITSPTAAKDVLLSPLSAGPELFSPSFLGVFFHALMENLPTYSKADAAALYVYVRDIASTQSFHMAHGPKLERLVAEGLRLLDIYFDSRLHKLLSTASRRYNEAEYSLFHGDDLIKRRPDLIFQTFEGDWYLVDFKTDHAAGEGEMRARAGRHSAQLNNYRAELSRLSGLSLTSHIYFAQTGILFPV